MRLRFGLYAALEIKPTWADKEEMNCSLCGTQKGDLLHYLCVCPAIKTLRVTLLKAPFNQKVLRTCRQAVIASVSAEDPKLVVKVIRVFNLVGLLLRRLKVREQH